ncbi:MAG: PKD domain-containing protein, partial [Methanomicrobiales archaeon]|nr:PKD domain-containing protein [Methanomicrobiales archaeon]
ISWLAPNTPYYFQACAKPSAIVGDEADVCGDILSFWTHPPVMVPAAVVFEYEEHIEAAPFTISFNDKTDPVLEPTSWLWNFGDGSTSFKQNPVHTYSEPGMYTVTMEVKNKEGIHQKIEVVYVQ